MDNSPIGIMDSGVGGLSILVEVKKILPRETFIFLADQANIPYGGKTQQELEQLLIRIMDFFMKKKVKMVVLACNTATVYTIDYLRESYKIPIIGTVPVVKTLAEITKTKKVAVFSTPATAKSKYLQNLIKKFAKDIKVYTIGGSNLEKLIEKGNVRNEKIETVLKKVLPSLIANGVDAIALGCTHYPFIKEQIEEIVGKNVVVLDSGGAVARHVKQVLKSNNQEAYEKRKDLYYTTGNAARFKNVAEELLGEKLPNVARIQI